MNYIPLESAKAIIVTALDRFNPELAGRAADILYNEDRLNIVKAGETRTNMMACRPAGVTIEYLKSVDMHIPDFAQRFGPHFTQQDNPTDHAIIDFEYDGTPGSVVWLAHELGHAIADDVQRENGHSFKDFSGGECEEQAYFVQRIVSQYMKENMSEPDVRDENLGQDVLKMSWDRAAQFTKANTIFDNALTKTPDERAKMTLKALDQRLG